ncbi:MAG: hypothetical protein VW741_01625 [Flammeovirgaceae bacterium]
MKIALCLFGLTGGTVGVGGQGRQIHPKNGYLYYKKNLIDQYDVDVFIHSWSTEFKNELIEIYKPKKHIIEPQREFNQITLNNFGYHEINDLRKHEPYFEPYKDLSDNEAFEKFETLLWRSYSRWYSTKMSINLKKEYELSNNIEYDFVISSRLDIALLKKIKFEKLDKSKFYASFKHGRTDFDKALFDLIFFSNSKIINEFSEIFDRFHKYSFRPTWAAKEHIEYIAVEVNEILKYEEDYKLLRWNQNYLISDYSIYLYVRHFFKQLKRKWLKN